MAIAFVAAASAGVNGGTVLTITKPTGTLSGHVLFASISVRQNGATATPPTGWTQVYTQARATSGTMYGFVKVAGGSEPASYDFTASVSDIHVGGIRTYSGVDTTTPVNVSGSQAPGSSASQVCPSVTTTVDGCMILRAACSASASGAGSYTWPTSTERFDQNTHGAVDMYISGADAAQATAGATGTETATCTQSATYATGTVALAPASVAVTSRRRMLMGVGR